VYQSQWQKTMNALDNAIAISNPPPAPEPEVVYVERDPLGSPNFF
jgi:hypothetical protein